jgi:hypothetical protein
MTRTAGHACATGTGEFRKQFSSVSTFTMPIGDATNYTPVSVAFSGGTFGTGAYVGSRVTASSHPNKPTATDYLNRYWSLSSSGITGFSSNLTFNFVGGDVVGTQGNLYCTKYLGSGSWQSFSGVSGNQLLANSVSSFSDWSGSSKIATTVDLTAFLQGPYNTSTGLMNTTINTYLPLSQPFNVVGTKWEYAGTESVGSIPNTDIVDWVLVELRHASTPANATSSTIIGRAAGFLKKDGSVVALDGSSNLKVNSVTPYSDNLYAVLYQRNHLGIMSNNAVTDGNSDGAFDYDYSTGSDKVYGGTGGYKELATGVWGMVAGDGNGDGKVFLTDYTTVWTPQLGSLNGYYTGDFNLDNKVFLTDYTTIWTPNLGVLGPVPASMGEPGPNPVTIRYISQIPD